MNKKTILVSMLLFVQGTFLCMAQNVARKELLTAVVRQDLSIVEVQKITLGKGVMAPKHMHPCPVVGYIVSGKVLFQIEGEEEKLLLQGDAFYEPKDKTIVHFDNVSSDEPLTFIVFYLKAGDEANIRMLNE